ncbi:hypothetical protein [Qipengyuania sp. MTN3-11]|uniref:hypothetical protein n=1 Tax=Qipengyuania sp. MTN3-11 TaxID=3056557 RepID=UPI0036F1C26D
MKTLAAIATAAAVALLATPATQAQESDTTAELSEGQAKLAKMLEGRVAGEPERCIQTFPSRSFTIIDDTALVYRRGDTLWVNTTRNPQSIDDDDILVIERFSGSQLCHTDQVTLRDRYNGFFSGVLFLGDFVPYREVEG